MPLGYARFLKGPDTARHSREGGNPERTLCATSSALDSRLRGNDVIFSDFRIQQRMLQDFTTKDTKRVTFVFFVVRTEFSNRIGRNPESKVRGGFPVTVVS